MKELFILLFILILYLKKNFIKLNTISIFVVLRGILSQSKFWWFLNDILLSDSNGNFLYKEYLEENPNKDFIEINIFGRKMYLVHKKNNIKMIMDNSPQYFGVGDLKYKFFESFMRKNVGVSEGHQWKRRRKLNMNVLKTDHLHDYARYYNKYIKKILDSNIMKLNKYEDFEELSKRISLKIVFNEDENKDFIFDIFSEANSLTTFFYNNYKISEDLMTKYKLYLLKNIQKPRNNSLVELSTLHENNISEIYHQIPHWIFPINGTLSVNVMRFLCIIYQDYPSYLKIQNSINKIDVNNPFEIYNLKFLRNCILEVLRLMNPVNSSFRTLLIDMNGFKKGDQFIIFNNPIMRDEKYFDEPNRFNPHRWTKELEEEYFSISFNQGPQRCPAKELIIFLLQSYIVHFIRLNNQIPNVEPKLNLLNIPQIINPYSIKFYY